MANPEIDNYVTDEQLKRTVSKNELALSLLLMQAIPLERRCVVLKVDAERDIQDKKWGVQNHDLPTWLAILTEEVGEAAQEVLAHKLGPQAEGPTSYRLNLFRKEMIQVAAVAQAILEAIADGRITGAPAS